MTNYLKGQGADVSSSDVMNQIWVQASGASASKMIAHLFLGFLVMGLVVALGGPTGPGLNPARDFGPRLVLISYQNQFWVKLKVHLNGGMHGFQFWHQFLHHLQPLHYLK